MKTNRFVYLPVDVTRAISNKDILNFSPTLEREELPLVDVKGVEHDPVGGERSAEKVTSPVKESVIKVLSPVVDTKLPFPTKVSSVPSPTKMSFATKIPSPEKGAVEEKLPSPVKEQQKLTADTKMPSPTKIAAPEKIPSPTPVSIEVKVTSPVKLPSPTKILSDSKISSPVKMDVEANDLPMVQKSPLKPLGSPKKETTAIDVQTTTVNAKDLKPQQSPKKQPDEGLKIHSSPKEVQTPLKPAVANDGLKDTPTVKTVTKPELANARNQEQGSKEGTKSPQRDKSPTRMVETAKFLPEKSKPAVDVKNKDQGNNPKESVAVPKEPLAQEESKKRGPEQDSKPTKKPKLNDHRFISPLSFKPIIDSATVTSNNRKCYLEPPQDFDPIAEFIYPSGDVEKFNLLLPKSDDYNPVQDIYRTVQLLAQYVPGLGDEKQGILRKVIKFSNLKNMEKLKETIQEYNDIIKKLPKADLETEQAAPIELVYHILDQSYARAIGPLSHQLNNYIGFSNNVYGEIKHSFTTEIINTTKLKPTDIFLDLGSGIGNVVLQVAGQCLCESYGIEIMENPSTFAKKQRTEFLARMRMYNKPCGRIYLKQGDFLTDESILQVIPKADVIFVNNYAFDAELNLGILALFLDLKETAQVVTLKPFAPVGGNKSLRKINAIESIFKVKEYFFPRGSVSWMMEGGSYYVHTLDRGLLA